MYISLTEDVKTLSELKDAPKAILKQIDRTGRPVVITVAGKPAAVIMEPELFEKRLKAVNLALLIAEAEADVRAGRVRPLDEFLSEAAT